MFKTTNKSSCKSHTNTCIWYGFKADTYYFLSLHSYNRRKLDELPYHYFQLHGNKLENSSYLTDISWIYDKVCGSNSYQILEDIYLCEDAVKKNNFVNVLKDFLEIHSSILNYDGRQFYGYFFDYLRNNMHVGDTFELVDKNIQDAYRIAQNPPVLSLVPIKNIEVPDYTSCANNKSVFKEIIFDIVCRLHDSDQYVVSVSTEKEEVCVWDVRT